LLSEVDINLRKLMKGNILCIWTHHRQYHYCNKNIVVNTRNYIQTNKSPTKDNHTALRNSRAWSRTIVPYLAFIVRNLLLVAMAEADG